MMDTHDNKRLAETLRHLRNLLDRNSRLAPSCFVESDETAHAKRELMASVVGALPDLLDLAEEALKSRVDRPAPPKERVVYRFEEVAEDAPVEGEALPLWKQLVELGKQIPDAEWANVPTDLCRNLGRYLYGSTQPPALAEDAPVMEWELEVGEVLRGLWRAQAEAHFGAFPSAAVYGMAQRTTQEALADLPAVRAAAEAYSAAKGCKAVFVGEGCEDA